MLRRAGNVHVAYDPMPFGEGWLVLHVGAEHFRVRRIEKSQFRAVFRWAEAAPQRIAKVDKFGCWLYRGTYFWDDEGLDHRQVRNALDPILATV